MGFRAFRKDVESGRAPLSLSHAEEGPLEKRGTEAVWPSSDERFCRWPSRAEVLGPDRLGRVCSLRPRPKRLRQASSPGDSSQAPRTRVLPEHGEGTNVAPLLLQRRTAPWQSVASVSGLRPECGLNSICGPGRAGSRPRPFVEDDAGVSVKRPRGRIETGTLGPDHARR